MLPILIYALATIVSGISASIGTGNRWIGISVAFGLVSIFSIEQAMTLLLSIKINTLQAIIERIDLEKQVREFEQKRSR